MFILNICLLAKINPNIQPVDQDLINYYIPVQDNNIHLKWWIDFVETLKIFAGTLLGRKI